MQPPEPHNEVKYILEKAQPASWLSGRLGWGRSFPAFLRTGVRLRRRRLPSERAVKNIDLAICAGSQFPVNEAETPRKSVQGKKAYARKSKSLLSMQ